MSSFTLKILAIIFMTIDHIGFLFFPKIKLLRAIGRLAFPLFAFQIGVGFKNTKNKEKYIFRMLIFTLFSQYPFYLAFHSAMQPNNLNIGATLTCGLLALYCLEKIDNKSLKYLSTLLVVLIGVFIPMDYGWLGILMIIILYYFNIDKIFASIFFLVIVGSDCIIDNSLFSLPQSLALFPMLLYNGKKGPNMKYLFYAFYPVHLIVLIIIKVAVLK